MRDKTVGLDIGTSSIKVSEVSSDGGRLLLTNFGLRDIPQASRPEELAGHIRSLFDDRGISAESVNTSLSGRSAIVRYVHFPKMTKDELGSALEFEIEKYIPFDKKDSIVDFQILDADNASNKIFVLLAAAKKEFVERRVILLKDAKLRAGMINMDPFCIINLFEFSKLEEGKGVYAIADIGFTRVHVSILKDGIPVLTREMDIKVNERAAALSEELEVTLNYFENQFGVSVSRVYVTGGGCAIDGLRASIKESAAADVIYWDPLTGVEIDEKIDKEALAGIKDRLAVSLGLCMIR